MNPTKHLFSRLGFLISLILLVGVFTKTSPPTASLGISSTITRSAQFNGTDSYYRMSHNTNLHPTDAITIEAWVKRNNANRCETVIGKDWETSYWLGFCNDTIRFYRDGFATLIDGTTPIPAGEWVHIAVTYDGTQRRYYINGELDLNVNDSGSIGTNTSYLGIGTNFNSSNVASLPFQGYIDEVRIWSVARTQEQIQSGMYRSNILGAGLIAAWNLDRSGFSYGIGSQSPTGNNINHTYHGVLPNHSRIYNHNTSVTVDGVCNGAEYSMAERLEVGAHTIVYMQHDDTDAYFCFAGLEQGAGHRAFLATETTETSRDPVDLTEYRFSIDIDGNPLVEQGTDGSFSPITDSLDWEAAHTTDLEFTWHAEFRLNHTLFNMTDTWSHTRKIMLGEARDGGFFAWPVGSQEVNPTTWGNILFSNATPAPANTFNFEGYVRDAANDAGIPNTQVSLFATTAGVSSIIETTQTDANGYYSFSHSGFAPAFFLIRQEDKRGYRSETATAGADGNAINANLLSYAGDDAPDTYSSGTFYDSRGLTFPTFDQHYLIIYGDPIDEGDLWPIIRQKRMQGFQVQTMSAETIDIQVNGRDRAERIRNWLINEWETHPQERIYVLLVGTADIIPIRQVAWEGDLAHRPAEPDGTWRSPALLTDWYYADLDSNWDNDNDGWYGEYIYCAPGESEVPTVAWPAPSPERAECPPSESSLRESPFGASNGNHDDWKAEIALGRLMIKDPAQLRTALDAMITAENSGSTDKRSAMLAGSFWFYEGRSWNPDENEYVEGGSPGSTYWVNYRWDNSQPYGDDTAIFLDDILKPAINPYLDQITKLYETTAPSSGVSPSNQIADMPVSHDNVEAQWEFQGMGLANLVGHGSGGGISAVHWMHDYDQSGVINQPAHPDSCAGTWCGELEGYNLIDKTMPEPASIAPVVFANACSTGDPFLSERRGTGDATYNVVWFGATPIAGSSLANGWASAWIGGLSVVPVHGLDGFQRDFNRDILANQTRLGDALWNHMETLVGADNNGIARDWRRATPQLFGDPARTYWGNGTDALAVWPQVGRDWFSSYASPYNGPSSGVVLWSRANVDSAPVVDRNGQVLVGGTGQVFGYAPNGDLVIDGIVDTVPLGLQHDFSPAIATDAIYIASSEQLYVLNLDLTIRDVIPLGSGVTGAPKVGPDGVVWVPTNNGIKRVLGDGYVETIGVEQQITGPVAFMKNGGVAWTSLDGHLYMLEIDRYGVSHLTNRLISATDDLNPPSVGADGTIYVSNDDGFVYAVGQWSFDVGTGIHVPPTIGHNGLIYVGTEDGLIQAINPNGTFAWDSWIGEPIASALTVDEGHVYVTTNGRLYQLDAYTGEITQEIDLGGAVNHRSTPVIGTGHIIYVTRADDTLVAVGPYLWLEIPSHLETTIDQLPAGNVQLQWRDNSINEAGFRIERCDQAGVCVETAVSPANTQQATLTNQPANTFGYYRIQAVSSLISEGGSTTPNSEFTTSDIIAPTPATPSTPTGLTITANSADSLTANWNYGGNDSQLMGFDIYRREGSSGTFELVASVNATDRTYQDAGLTANTTHEYRLASKNAGGTSTLTGIQTGTTWPQTIEAPTSFMAEQTACSFDLTWQDNATDETNYLIERQLPGVSTYEFVAMTSANTTSWTDAHHLVYDGTLGYRIKAIGTEQESAHAFTTITWDETCAATASSNTTIYLPIIIR